MRVGIFGGKIRGYVVMRFASVCMAAVLVCALTELASAQFPGVSFNDPANSARVLVSTGRVSVSRTGQLWVLNPGDTVSPSQEIVTGDNGYAVFELEDGSRFEVYPNSRVLFRTNTGNWSDILDIWVGRLKIHIEKMMGKPNPHRIHTPTAVISVRGTTFYVEVEEDSEATIVGVEEGEVVVDHRLVPTGQSRILRQGEELRVSRDEPIAKAKVDKGGVLRATFRALSEALYVVAVETRRGGGGATVPGNGGPLPGDQDPQTPPPAEGGGSPTSGTPTPPPPPPGV